MHLKNLLFLLFFLVLNGHSCSKAAGPGGQEPPGDFLEEPGAGAKASPIPYIDTLLSPSESEVLGEKYRAIFSNENILKAMTFDGLTPFPEWEEESQKKLLQTLLFYEENRGTAIPPFEGNCRMEPGPDGCFSMRDLKVSMMEFLPEYSEYLKRMHVAWNLYVEANRIVPWSLLDYSLENLKILFYTSNLQPKLGTQHFAAAMDIAENYKILRGTLREPRDSNQDLVGASSLETILNTLEFVGERVTHFLGSARNNMGPQSGIWPYRAREEQGNPLYDPRGIRIPLNRLPTPKEILIYRDPHHDLARRPQAIHGPQFHIVNGCWGTSKLLQSLLAAVNIPVQLKGDYFNFGGHSGVKFAQVEGHDYWLHHSDNIFHFPWAGGILKAKELLQGMEQWNAGDFFPFRDAAAGYNVLHTDEAPLADHQEILNFLKIPADKVDLFHLQLGVDFGGYDDFDLRVLALRALQRPSVQNLYTRCLEPGMERRHLPLEYLTEAEELLFVQGLDQRINRLRVDFILARPSCLDLFLSELRDLYKKKTGLDIKGNEDGDGFLNHRDCRPALPDNAPCEDAFKEALGISTQG